MYSSLLTCVPNDISYNELDEEVSLPTSTTIVSIPPLDTNNEMIDSDEFNQLLMANVSRRLHTRKVLHSRLCATSNVMCFLGLLGIILMIIESEMTFMNIEKNEINLNWFIKTIITITTIGLVILVFYYHHLDLSLYAVNNSLDHWRVGLTARKIFLILFEAFICGIHPIPQRFPFMRIENDHNSTTIDKTSPSYIDIDVALGLPMFCRIYLVCRFVMFHSHLVHNVSFRSFGCINKVSINFFFVMKTYLEQWPTRCLSTFCMFLLLIGSWSLRACNYNPATKQLSMLNAMWLFIVTFTTIGYGDFVPSNYCGRSVAAISALIGVFSTALLISVLAQKLKLKRSEKYVHNLVLDIGLAKERKEQAANVIKFALQVWYLKRKHQPTSIEYIKAERRLFRSIHFNQQLKQKQKNLIDSCVGLPELLTIQREINATTQENEQKLIVMKLKVDTIEKKLYKMNKTMINIRNTLNVLLKRIS